MVRRRTRGLVAAIVVLIVAACGEGTASPDASAGGDREVIELMFAPAGIDGCDAIGVDYRTVTFVIDPAAEDDVTATTDTGARLTTRWAPGFVGGPAAERVVLDPSGQVVARDGEQLVNPPGAWPRLHGYRVCPAPDHLTILLARG